MEFSWYNKVFYIFVLRLEHYELNVLDNFRCNEFSIVACISKYVHAFWCST